MVNCVANFIADNNFISQKKKKNDQQKSFPQGETHINIKKQENLSFQLLFIRYRQNVDSFNSLVSSRFSSLKRSDDRKEKPK